MHHHFLSPFDRQSRSDSDSLSIDTRGMRDMGRSEGIDTDHSHQPAYPHAGWKMDIEDSGRKEVSDPLSPEGKDRAAEEESGHRQSLGDSSPSTPFTFTFPSASFPSGSGNTAPTRRRAVAPSTIPNFPSSNEARNPPSQTPFTLSPSRSIAPLSPFRSPATPPQTRQPFLPIALPQPFGPVNTAVSSPWHTLAATSGAPTPSIESEPSIGRNSSPHLGYPFERLNIGGSWSGANLWAEGGQGRRSSLGSLEGTHGQNAGTSPSKGSPKVTSHPMSGGLSLETVAKYRAVAGKTSSPKGSHKREEGFAMEGVESIRTSFASPSSHIQVPGDLARRRASLPKNSLNALSPTQAHSAKSPSPLASSSSASTPSPGPAKLQPLSTLTLRSLIPKSSTLILDLRPPSAFHASHLPSSHSLPIPSTLLRRPAFTLQKLTRMLTPPFNEEVAKWREKKDVVLLDLDSTAAPDGSVLEGLASKFEREGFTGRVWFVKGGQKAVQSMSGMNLSSEDGEGAEENEATPTVTSAPSGMMAGRLGKLAFLHDSTGSGRKSKPGMKLNLAATPGLAFRADPFAASSTMSTTIRTVNPMSDLSIGARPIAVSSNGSISPAIKLQPANPFFDNIRQNLELSHGGITERIPLALGPEVVHRAAELPSFLSDLVRMSDKECSDRLADQFFRIELGEQKRLQAVMDFHSKGSGATWAEKAGHDPEAHCRHSWLEERAADVAEVERLAAWGAGTNAVRDNDFPFSITAGVERGSKNRYKNIWPYDFSRVRLTSLCDDESDYINASFVYPRGTARRYIATQGPLDATYRDFWTLVWEQDVRVIAMLTKQFEGGLPKCGNYWEDQNYGHLHLKLLSHTGGDDKQQQQATTGFNFGAAALPPHTTDAEKVDNIRRVFLLSHNHHPGPGRKVVQIQCTAWPDFDVPDSPEILLNLIRDVDGATEELCGGEADDQPDHPPVLVHCSAGVGRTGSFIIVDAIVDNMRQEMRKSIPGSSTSFPSSPGRSILAPRSRRSSPSSISSGRKPSGSGESTKSVSFLSPFPSQKSAESLTAIFSTSPAAMSTFPEALTTPMPGSSNPSASSYLDAKATRGSADHDQRENSMELDPPAELSEGVMRDIPGSREVDDRFTKHRGSIAASIESEEGWTRRPSLTSAFNSSEKLSGDAIHRNSSLASITESPARPRTPTAISEMENPIASVLEGMRVQRMSLVQSLRQYLFVHRAIIQSYLGMVDEDRDRYRRRAKSESIESEAGAESGSRSSTAPLTMASTNPSSIQGTDDESHVKRRASPTDLRPGGDDGMMIHGPTGLTKRPSVKRMRAEVEGVSIPSSAPGQGGKDGPGRTRSRSKLGLEGGRASEVGQGSH